MRSRSRTQTLAVMLIAIGALYLQSCQGIPTERLEKKQPSTTSAEKAERTGDYVRAAQEYERAAEQAEDRQKQNLQLKAIETLVKAGQIAEARVKIQAIDVARLGPALRARKFIIEARIASNSGAYDDALRFLNQAQRTRNLDPALLADIYRVRAAAKLGLGDSIGAVKNLIVREQYIVGKDAIADNQLRLWEILNSLPRATLKREMQASADPALTGWIALAIKVIENSGRPGLLAKSIRVWKETYPDHPASDSLLVELASSKPGLIGRIDRIALLLPLSSTYANLAQAVRDGVLAMDAANADPDKPKIKIYDIGGDSSRAPEYYAQAISDGAQLIIGPLGRQAVDTVVREADLAVPTVLLGDTREDSEPLPGYVFQFGLPPEQEARQAAERAYLDGYRQAAVLYANTDWGERLLKAFATHWQQLGGIMLASVSYNPAQNDQSKPIKQLLNIAQSEARQRTLEARLGMTLKLEPRRREDVDFIFLAADAKRARLIKPQLNFFRALNIPVYATSSVFTGKVDPVRDTDLDGITFGDMPWILVNDGKIQDLRQALERNRPYAHSPLDRLFALGMDSYSIIPHLNRISTEDAARFSGVTSGLSVGRDGRLQRQLLWAKFSRGKPKLLDTFLQYSGWPQQFKSDSEKTRPPAPRS